MLKTRAIDRLPALCLAGMLTASAISPLPGQEPFRAADHVKRLVGLDGYVRRTMRDWDVPGVALGIVGPDSLLYAAGFGVRQVDRPEGVDIRTVFGNGSTTKAFTAVFRVAHWQKPLWEGMAGMFPFVTFSVNPGGVPDMKVDGVGTLLRDPR